MFKFSYKLIKIEQTIPDKKYYRSDKNPVLLLYFKRIYLEQRSDLQFL